MFKIDLNTQETMLIDWINCLDIPSCSLVDSIDDLKSGIIPLEILSYLKSSSIPMPNRLASSKKQVLSNWSLFLSELPKNLKDSLSLSPEEILEDDLQLIKAMNSLSSIKKNNAKPPSFAKATDLSSLNGLPPRPISGFIGHKFMQQSPEKTSKSAPEPEDNLRNQKEFLLDWLEKLNVIRHGSADVDLLMSICRTGVLYSDLVNRLEGKSEVIKGVERNPKNKTQALNNINKTLEYLKSQEKMKSRFLWAGKEIVEGKEEPIIGLLIDIKDLYTQAKTQAKTKTSSPNTSFNTKLEDSPDLSGAKQSRSYSVSMRRTPTLSQTPVSVSRLSQTNSSKNIRKEVTFSLPEDAKRVALEWIQALGVEYTPSNNPYTDTLKNGVVLCELLRVLESESVKINPAPRNKKGITENLDKVLQVFKRKKNIGESSMTNPGKLSEHLDLLIAFIYTLMKLYPKAVSLDYQDHPLPYGALGIKLLEKSTVKWVISLNLIQPDPQDFNEIIPEIKSGVLLCVLVSKAFSLKIPSIVRDPRTELAIMGNIRKALDTLRKIPEMSQKYLYSAKEIYKGSAGVTLGLLEDIHRCADGLPARKSGEEYYKDGPYISKENSARSAWKPDSFNATFGSNQSPKKGDSDIYTHWITDQKVSLPPGINFSDATIPEFTTGVIFCSLLNSLENRPITGVINPPLSKASSLSNISKALSILKKKKGFPADLLNIEEDLFKGNGAIIRKLIESLMKLYSE